MKKTVSQVAKEFYRNWKRTDYGLLPAFYWPLLRWTKSNGTFYYKDSWRDIENAGKAYTKNPLCLWADAHTLSVEDEVITITRDENNHVSSYEYKLNSFNTICVKNLDEARKIENNNGLFSGLYVVDYATKKVYRLVAKLNDKVRLERILNTYVTRLPWLWGETLKPKTKDVKIEEAFGGKLNTTNQKPSENGY